LQPAEFLTAEQVFERMISAYRGASAYRDEGVFRAVLTRGEERTEDAAPLSVVFARPNQLAVRAYQAAFACDGAMLRAKILDEPSRDLDGQIVERPLREKLTLDNIFSDAVLRESLGGRLGLHPPQLELLLAEKPFSAFRDARVRKHLLRQQPLEGGECYRVEVELQGRYVFWIDRENFLLRRLEYPGEALLTPEEAAGADLTIVAEFPQAQIGAPATADEFTLQALDVTVPEDAKKVRFFVIPPQPLPTELFGKRPKEFEFDGLDGSTVTAETLAGKIAVLVWFSNHPGSRACLEALQETSSKLGDNADVVFYAVCTEPTTIGNAKLRDLAAEWKIGVPVVRDLGAFGRDAFDIRVAPSLVVLDKTGAVQIHESGDNPHLATVVQEQLPSLLERLASGEDFAVAILTQARAEQEAYLANLAAASAEAAPASDPLAPAELAPRTDPQHLTLEPLWICKELSRPGNMLVLNEGRSPRIFVLDGGRSMAELDATGATLRRLELDLPENEEVHYLRTTTDAKGNRYYSALAHLGQQAHVFDADGKKVMSYPAADEQHDGLRDGFIAELGESGAPLLLVGFDGLVGVHGVDLAGRRLWSNREMTPVTSLAASHDRGHGRRVLVTGNEGRILPLDASGNADPPLSVKQRAIHRVITASWGADRPTAYLGFTDAPEGNLIAIGLSADFEEMWSYRLPRGAYANQIDVAVPCRLLDREGGQWLLAGPDGSVHIISDDGDFFDYFQSGERLTGIHGFRTSEGGVLLLSSEAKVAALRLP
jgi:hypothetical protein